MNYALRVHTESARRYGESSPCERTGHDHVGGVPACLDDRGHLGVGKAVCAEDQGACSVDVHLTDRAHGHGVGEACLAICAMEKRRGHAADLEQLVDRI